MITDTEIAAVIARVDDALHMHDRYAALRAKIAANKPAPTAAPAQPAHAPKPANPIGGAAITKPAPAPRGPRPGGIAMPLPTRIVDEIMF
jgi:hypothetical protein